MTTTYKYIVEYNDGIQLKVRNGMSGAAVAQRLAALNMKDAVTLTIEKDTTYTKPEDIALWPRGNKTTFCYKISDGRLPKNLMKSLSARHR